MLNCLKVILQYALRMSWQGKHPRVKRLHGEYPDGVRISKKDMKPYEARLERSKTLPKYDITIKCNKPGYQEAAYLNHSGVSATIATNIAVDIVLTLGVASIVDSANGADNKYDSVVNITLVPVAPPQPD